MEAGFGRSLASGFTGAVALTAAHQLLRTRMKHPPRMDVLGRRAIARGYKLAGRKPPRKAVLQRQALVSDLLSNAAYYAVGTRRGLRGGVFSGLLAGLGAWLLPPSLGLGFRAARATRATKLATVGIYTLGGAVAGFMQRRLGRRALPS